MFNEKAVMETLDKLIKINIEGVHFFFFFLKLQPSVYRVYDADLKLALVR